MFKQFINLPENNAPVGADVFPFQTSASATSRIAFTDLKSNITSTVQEEINTINGSITGLQLQIDNITYVSPVISGVSISPSTVEIGKNNFTYTITGNINKVNDANTSVSSSGLTLVWNTQSNFSLSKSVTSQLVSNQAHTIYFDNTYNSVVHSTSYTTTLYVQNKRWWGVSTGTSITGSISSLINNEFSTGYTQSKTFNATGGKYLYFSFPATFTGTPVFKVGGLVAPFNELSVISNTNAEGYVSNFRVFRSTNLQNGSSITVDVS